MEHSIINILIISRPRFWLYLAGTFILGSAIGAHHARELFSFSFLYNFLYFLIPANIFLYGINDYNDEDTDKFNEKKRSKEHLLLQKERHLLKRVLIICAILTLLIAFIQKPIILILFLTFLFLSWGYSSPPLRFKARPLFDSSSNVLYAIPGFIGYLQFQDSSGIFLSVVLGFCWISSMHLFSAIPDIIPDSKARIRTTAVVLGQKKSLLLCTFLWGVFFILLLRSGFIFPYSLIAGIYILIPLFLLIKKLKITHVYWYFPYINGLLGFFATVIVLFEKI